MTSPVRLEDVYMTPEEFLAAEEISETKHEYLAGVVYAMAGGTPAHGRITSQIIIALGRRLDDKPCFPFGPDVILRINFGGSTFFYYPDVAVDCSRPGEKHLEKPTVIFEVLAKKTERIDRGDKLTNYKLTPSLRVYGLVDQYRPAVTLHRWHAPGEWKMEFYGNLADVISLPEIECELPMSEIYREVL